jgi:hypothetical protein
MYRDLYQLCQNFCRLVNWLRYWKVAGISLFATPLLLTSQAVEAQSGFGYTVQPSSISMCMTGRVPSGYVIIGQYNDLRGCQWSIPPGYPNAWIITKPPTKPFSKIEICSTISLVPTGYVVVGTSYNSRCPSKMLPGYHNASTIQKL